MLSWIRSGTPITTHISMSLETGSGLQPTLFCLLFVLFIINFIEPTLIYGSSFIQSLSPIP